MSWLEHVDSVNLFDPASLSGQYRLKPHTWGTMFSVPLMNDASMRVYYQFSSNQGYILAPSESEV